MAALLRVAPPGFCSALGISLGFAFLSCWTWERPVSGLEVYSWDLPQHGPCGEARERSGYLLVCERPHPIRNFSVYGGVQVLHVGIVKYRVFDSFRNWPRVNSSNWLFLEKIMSGYKRRVIYGVYRK